MISPRACRHIGRSLVLRSWRWGIASDRKEEARIRFTFDYVDPGSFLAFELVGRWIEAESPWVSIDWRPLELRTPASPPPDPKDPEWEALSVAMEAIAAEEGLRLERPALIPWTRKAHELAFHAREKQCFDAVHRALFEAHFLLGRDLGRVDHLVELGQAHGLEPAETRTVLGVDRFVPQVEDARAAALASGIRGVPTIEAGGERVEGLEHPAALRGFLSRVGGTRRDGSTNRT